MNKLKVSVIIPVYNSEHYLPRCLASILNQTYENIEVIIINDGSTDNSTKICNQFKNKDKRVTVKHNINQGVSKSRNDGIHMSTGEYIVFVDSDDFLEPNMLNEMIERVKRNRIDLVIVGHNKVNIKERKVLIEKTVTYGKKHLINKEELYEFFYPFIDESYFHKIWSKLYKTEIIKDNRIFFPEDMSIAEDFIFNIKYINQAHSCVFIDKPCYNYVLDQNYLTNKFDPSAFNNRKKSLIILEDFYHYNNLDNTPLFYQYIKAAYAQMMMLWHPDNNYKIVEKKRIVRKILKDEKILMTLQRYTGKDNKEKLLIKLLKLNNEIILVAFSAILRMLRLRTRIEF